jgi:hypothetical protein
MAYRDEQHHRSAQDVPPVGRPKGAVWRSLQADGVVWEGQVLLVGGDVDLAARMIVTHRRVAFVRGGELVLELPRGWLRQEPVLRRDGVLELFVSTPDSNPFDEPMKVFLRMQEGHPAAGHIIAMLAPGGVRRITPDSISAIDRARESAPTARYGSFWDGIDDDSLAVHPRISSSSNGDGHARADAQSHTSAMSLKNMPPLEPPDRLVRAPSSPDLRPNLPGFTIAGMVPRDQRRSPWTLLLRCGALIILLATAAALGAGRLHLQLPGSGIEPILAAPTATVPAANAEIATETPAAATDSTDDQTALEIGVGGPARQAATSTPSVAVVPAETVFPTPAPTREAPRTASTESVLVPANTSTATETETSGATPSTATLAQPATVAAVQPSGQEMEVGPMRLAISTAYRAESLPAYGLPPGSGEWLLLEATLSNESNSAESLAMSDVQLVDRATGTVTELDSGTGVIAELAGIDPALAPEDAIEIAAGEEAEALFLYLLPAGSTDDLALTIGQSTLEVGPSLEESPAP